MRHGDSLIRFQEEMWVMLEPFIQGIIPIMAITFRWHVIVTVNLFTWLPTVLVVPMMLELTEIVVCQALLKICLWENSPWETMHFLVQRKFVDTILWRIKNQKEK